MTDNDGLNKKLFGENFHFGVSTAAYQIEGAHDADGKGPSIWDVFTTNKGKILNGDNGSIACDFYSRYPEDLRLLKQLNIPNFRFSIAWSRILPQGFGKVNQKGIDFYNRVIDTCLELGVQPWVTLYHWDLPQALEAKGGWTNREIVAHFFDFSTLCAKFFGDRIKYWMVMNEPTVFTGAGYFFGIHAPGRRGMKNFLPAVHHAALSIAEGGRALRSALPSGTEIGSTFSCSYVEPYSTKSRDERAARRVDALLNRLFIEPSLGMGYPVQELPALKKIEKYFVKGDEEKLKFDFDFVGLQNYTREIVKHSFFVPYLGAKLVAAEKRKVDVTAMKWEVYPPAIYQMIKQFDRYPGIRKIIVTENGAAFPDSVVDGEINDVRRIDYLERHLLEVLRAKNEGCKVEGYFVWTLTDNFEWAEGYGPRFGLVHVDFVTQKRTIKNSGYRFANFLDA